MKIAVIPARGGSKRIPRKNIKLFCGKPMIAWSINAALDSACFDEVIVSTDDMEIAELAKSFGALVPFIRPKELSDDYATTVPVIAHATNWVNMHMSTVDLVCCLYATAPFIKAQDILDGLNLINREEVDYVYSVTSFAYSIQRALSITLANRIEMINEHYIDTRSQDLQEAWHDAGQFYWGRANSWLDNKPLFKGNAAPVCLPRYRVQDIDTLEDWDRAEILFQVLQNTGKIGKI